MSRSLTIYLSDQERKRYKKEAQERGVSRSEHIRWCVLNGRFIPEDAPTKDVPKVVNRKANVVNVPDPVHSACTDGAEKHEMTMSNYANWCVLNEKHIPRKRGKLSTHNRPVTTLKAPEKPKEHPALLALVGEMTLQELADCTGCTVAEIVEWTLGPPPNGQPSTEKTTAKEADAAVLRNHLKVVVA